MVRLHLAALAGLPSHWRGTSAEALKCQLSSCSITPMKIVEVRHPLVQHKIGLLRDASMSTKDFREVVNELGTLLAYEATADLDT